MQVSQPALKTRPQAVTSCRIDLMSFKKLASQSEILSLFIFSSWFYFFRSLCNDGSVQEVELLRFFNAPEKSLESPFIWDLRFWEVRLIDENFFELTFWGSGEYVSSIDGRVSAIERIAVGEITDGGTWGEKSSGGMEVGATIFKLSSWNSEDKFLNEGAEIRDLFKFFWISLKISLSDLFIVLFLDFFDWVLTF